MHIKGHCFAAYNFNFKTQKDGVKWHDLGGRPIYWYFFFLSIKKILLSKIRSYKMMVSLLDSLTTVYMKVENQKIVSQHLTVTSVSSSI